MSTKIVWLDASQKKHFIDASTSESFIIKSQESVESFSLGGGSKRKSETELEWLIIFFAQQTNPNFAVGHRFDALIEIKFVWKKFGQASILLPMLIHSSLINMLYSLTIAFSTSSLQLP